MPPAMLPSADEESQLANINIIDKFSWHNLTVTVKTKASADRTTNSLNILEGVSGWAQPGDMIALMGPSGSGKTTLLNVLARRPAAASATVSGEVLLDGMRFSTQSLREISTFVEQDEALIGCLTVRETIEFAARLSSPSAEEARVSELIKAFGLEKQEHTIIGTVLKKGISGGQKRRVSVASQLITKPKILFLDEPTSGLDSTAAYEVISRVRRIAREENMIVIASIHQPSTKTFNLFSHLILLSRGRTVYSGKLDKVQDHFKKQGLPIPAHENPAEFLVDVCNLDFQRELHDGDGDPVERVERLIGAHAASSVAGDDQEPKINYDNAHGAGYWKGTSSSTKHGNGVFRQTLVLLHRLWIKSYRDPLPYWIRVIMYLGLAVMMGTVWLRLGSEQANINPFISALFFSSAFMAFMAVSYVPAYLEDYLSYHKEHANGLYGPTAFLVSNFLIALPFLFVIAAMFAIITVFLVNMKNNVTSFFTNIMWLFLDLVAAESLVVLVASLIPNFVGALAIVAFANGLFMSVGGFLVPENLLNVFWYYTFYWIDYQRYVFQGLMWNEFAGRVYTCHVMEQGRYQCMYEPIPGSPGKIAGSTILHSLGYKTENRGLWVGLLVAIVAAMRLMTAAYLALGRRAHA